MRQWAIAMVVVFLSLNFTKAQESSVGIQFGTFQYTGELSKEFFRTKNLHGAFGFNYQKPIAKGFDMRFQYSHGLIDYYQGETKFDTLQWSFKTRLNSFDLNIVYRLNNGYILPEDCVIQPYLVSGMNILISASNHYPDPWRLDYAFPFGWGIDLPITKHLKAGLFSTFYYTLSDNLDGYDRSQQNLSDNLMDRFLYSGLQLRWQIDHKKI